MTTNSAPLGFDTSHTGQAYPAGARPPADTLGPAADTAPRHASGTGGSGPAAESAVIGRVPAWASLAALLVGTAVLYLWDLGASGYANSFYSAAAQAGGADWKAWFYGSLDAGNAITVDKPPASLWLMGLSVRLFGLSSWSILVPEALLGVASVGVLYATLRRLFTTGSGGVRTPLTVRSHVAALLGAAVFALTPVATLMFRFNNPDALLIFCQVLAAYFTLRAAEKGRPGWLIAAGAIVGLGFLTKMLQAFLVLPALVAAYAIAAPVSWAKRIVHLLYAFGAMVVSAGWYIAIVELVPASERPYIGGSQNNSILELTLGYNGFGRITGNETGSVTGGGMGGGAGGGMWGETGPLRLFSGVSGGMVSWLIPAALVLGIAALVLLRRRARTDLVRAGIIAFGGWLVVTMVVFSWMAGIYHDYYTVALAPQIGATLALGAWALWGERQKLWTRIVLAAALLGSAVWAIVLLSQATGIYAALRLPVGLLAAIGAAGIILLPRLGRPLAAVVAGVAVVAALAGPASYALNTAATPHTGSIVTAGPVQGGVGGRGGGPGGQGAPGGQGGFGGQGGQGGPGGQGTGTGQGGFGGQGTGTGQMPQGLGQAPGGAGTGTQGGTGTGAQGGAGTGAQGNAGQMPGGTGTGQMPGGTGQSEGGFGGAGGGILGGADVSEEVATLLSADADNYTWVAAAVGSQNAASYQLATEEPVMALGGFNGSDPSPTLEQFQQYVAEGRVHYFISGGMGGQQNGGSNAASEIASWVEANYTAQTVGSTTVYDLTQPAS